jgi:hypothetical protein
MVAAETAVGNDLLREQVDRIVHSDEFRGSEVLCRLLIYLAEKAASGEADKLKEYVVAIEGLGRPASYDPQQNSAVRIQVGRLRQKLAEYYRNEGVNDPLILDLPKGRFRLVYERRKITPEPLQVFAIPSALPPPEAESSLRGAIGRSYTIWWAIAATAALSLGIGFALRGLIAKSTVAASSMPLTQWTPETDMLWGSFVNSKRPLLVLIEDPLFVELHSNPGVYYRDRSLNQWSEIEHSQTMQSLSTTLKSSGMQPSHYYTAFGEVQAAFQLGRLLGPRLPLFSLGKASQVSWQQMSDNNVIFVGVENLFFEQAGALPIAPQLVPVLNGVKNSQPAPGEQSLYRDEYQTAPTETGIVYALVTHLPGPLGSNDVDSFTSNRSAGYVAAVQAFADPISARSLVKKLKASSGGNMPRYYQVVLRVRFRDDVPTETTYVLGRELK